MIGQYLSNTDKNTTVYILQKIMKVNKASMELRASIITTLILRQCFNNINFGYKDPNSLNESLY